LDPEDIRRIYDEINALPPSRLFARADLLLKLRAADPDARRAAQKDRDFVAALRDAYDRDQKPEVLERLRGFCRKEQVRQWQRRKDG
jgi:hypothetical protein